MSLMSAFALLAVATAAAEASSSSSSSAILEEEVFTEQLTLRPAASGDVAAFLSFATVSPSPADLGARSDFHLFPRAIGDLMEVHGVREMDISLTRGVWRDKRWGRSPSPAPPGAKVSAWFDPSLSASGVDAAWSGLTNSLAGQLCASLNFLYSTQTVSPELSFQPEGVFLHADASNNASSSHFKLGFLPGENVCTENLSPWKKLLPCQSKRGLSALLSAKNLHHTRYHSLGLSLRHVCPGGTWDCSRPSVELVQKVTLVFSPALAKENQTKSPVSWSVRTLFGIGLLATCPLASTSKIVLEGANKMQTLKAEPAALATVVGRSSNVEFDVVRLVEEGHNNLQVSYQRGDPQRVAVRTPEVQASRYQVGYGQEQGEMVAKVTNSLDTELNVVYLDVLPWYLRVYFHTLTVREEGSGRLIQPVKSSFGLGVDRERPYSVELVLRLPARSTVKISLQYEKSILKWLEYPPDANHGFYLSPAVVSYRCPAEGEGEDDDDDCGSSGLRRVYTETLLLNLPTPDFSMPYNVICLACTVIAVAFGPLHNITTKTLIIETGPERPSIVRRIYWWVKALVISVLVFLRLKKKEEEEEKQDDDNEEKEQDEDGGTGEETENGQDEEDSEEKSQS